RGPRPGRDRAPAGPGGDRQRAGLARAARDRPADHGRVGAGGGGPAVKVELTLNGRAAAFEARTDEMLLAVLRREGLLSVRETCAIGVCGACTVLVDGEPVSGCLVLAVAAAGREVTTVEGVAGHPVQRALADSHGFQCG